MMLTPTTIIGTATLYLGDAYLIRPALGFMDADITDPPYEFASSGGGKWRKARGASDQIAEQDLDKGFDLSIINPLLCGAAIVFCHQNQVHALSGYLDGSFHRSVQLHWIKENPTPHRNKNYLADVEHFFHAWQRGYEPVGEHHDMHRYVTAPVGRSALYDHPTVKPDKVMDKILRNVPGDRICDPFMGTGSTGVAALKAGKSFIGIEQNPKHFETACRRLNDALSTKEN